MITKRNSTIKWKICWHARLTPTSSSRTAPQFRKVQWQRKSRILTSSSSTTNNFVPPRVSSDRSLVNELSLTLRRFPAMPHLTRRLNKPRSFQTAYKSSSVKIKWTNQGSRRIKPATSARKVLRARPHSLLCTERVHKAISSSSGRGSLRHARMEAPPTSANSSKWVNCSSINLE